MPRDIDAKTTRKALRKLRRAVKRAEEAGGLSAWEQEFAESVEERLEEYGSAFSDPEKGGRDDALSVMQALKVREIGAKGKAEARERRKPTSRRAGKGGGVRKRSTPRVRHVEDD